MQFDHVISPAIRNVLYGATDKPGDILQAAYLTNAAMCDDWKSQHISFETMEARERCVDCMDICIADNDLSGAVDCMKSFWSI